MSMSIYIQRFIEKYYPDVIRAGHEKLSSELIPTASDIQRLHIIARNTGECEYESKLLFVAAFLFLYDKKVILVDHKLKTGLRGIIADQLSINRTSVSLRISDVKIHYTKLRTFREKVERLLEQFNKPATAVINAGEGRE